MAATLCAAEEEEAEGDPWVALYGSPDWDDMGPGGFAAGIVGSGTGHL